MLELATTPTHNLTPTPKPTTKPTPKPSVFPATQPIQRKDCIFTCRVFNEWRKTDNVNLTKRYAKEYSDECKGFSTDCDQAVASWLAEHR